MEPWDGPASIAFTDGVRIGAVLDRNGLRPSRYYVTKDDLVIMASEVGVLDMAPEKVLHKGRLQPGRMFLVDMEQGRIIADEELKKQIATAHPYDEWLRDNLVSLEQLPPGPVVHEPDHETVLLRQQAFGYTSEDLKILMAPMARDGNEAIGSMGNDAALAVLSDRPQLLYNYFKQLFAQVTNPPVDCIREEIIMSMETTIGAEYNLLEPTPRSARQIKLKSPILNNDELDKLRQLDGKGPGGFKSVTLPILFPVKEGAAGLEKAMDGAVPPGQRRGRHGPRLHHPVRPRPSTATMAPIPALLAVAGVHHHLIREGTRTKVGLVLESGEPREVHHFALLIGYGAGAINPYLAFETLDDMIRQGELSGIDPREGGQELRQGGRQGRHEGHVQDGHLDGPELLRRADLRGHRPGPGGHRQVLHLDRLAHLRRRPGRHRRRGQGPPRPRLPRAAAQRPHARRRRPVPVAQGGRVSPVQPGDGPQAAVRLSAADNYKVFKEYSELVNNQAKRLCTLRGLFDLKLAEQPIPIEEVEPVESILKRFKSGAMSYGSISQEAHETLAIAMNRIGGKSNTGEGGEDPARYVLDANGDSRNSAIKQVASGRFGVTSEYLVNAQELQIKMAQGAKPGEGGQLPGSKVYPWIAKVRHSTPGVGLISPPPHHDIYSIEDLAELIHDLKNAQPRTRASASSWWPRSASAPSRRASPRPTPTWCSSAATTAAPAPRR